MIIFYIVDTNTDVDYSYPCIHLHNGLQLV